MTEGGNLAIKRVGLIGCGQFGSFIAAALERAPGARLVAVCDHDQEAAAALARRMSAEVAIYEDAESALGGDLLDLVVVATPPWTHGDLAVQSLDAGCHVLVEKPLAVDVAGCRRVAAAAEANGRIVAVDHLLRFAPLVIAVNRLLRAGEPERRLLGDVARFAFENDAADEGLPSDHWFWDKSRSGGVFVEHGVHFFDLATWFIGSAPTTVQAMAVGARSRTHTVCATATFTGDATATWYHSFTHRRVAERQHWRIGVRDAEIRLEGWVPLTLEIEVVDGEIAAAVEVVLAGVAAELDGALQLHLERRESDTAGGPVIMRFAHRGADAKDRV